MPNPLFGLRLFQRSDLEKWLLLDIQSLHIAPAECCLTWSSSVVFRVRYTALQSLHCLLLSPICYWLYEFCLQTVADHQYFQQPGKCHQQNEDLKCISLRCWHQLHFRLSCECYHYFLQQNIFIFCILQFVSHTGAINTIIPCCVRVNC